MQAPPSEIHCLAFMLSDLQRINDLHASVREDGAIAVRDSEVMTICRSLPSSIYSIIR